MSRLQHALQLGRHGVVEGHADGRVRVAGLLLGNLIPGLHTPGHGGVNCDFGEHGLVKLLYRWLQTHREGQLL